MVKLSMNAVRTKTVTLPTSRVKTLLVILSLCTVPYAHLHADTQLVGDVKAGSEIYNAVCKGCHGVSIAPTLRGVVGRPIASTDFAGYSEGLKAKQAMTWTPENLDTFLTAPLEFAPGTLMVQTIPEPQKRANIIAFLEKLPPPRK